MFFEKKCKRKGIFSGTNARERAFIHFLMSVSPNSRHYAPFYNIFEQTVHALQCIQNVKFCPYSCQILSEMGYSLGKFCNGVYFVNFVRERVRVRRPPAYKN